MIHTENDGCRQFSFYLSIVASCNETCTVQTRMMIQMERVHELLDTQQDHLQLQATPSEVLPATLQQTPRALSPLQNDIFLKSAAPFLSDTASLTGISQISFNSQYVTSTDDEASGYSYQTQSLDMNLEGQTGADKKAGGEKWVKSIIDTHISEEEAEPNDYNSVNASRRSVVALPAHPSQDANNALKTSTSDPTQTLVDDPVPFIRQIIPPNVKTVQAGSDVVKPSDDGDFTAQRSSTHKRVTILTSTAQQASNTKIQTKLPTPIFIAGTMPQTSKGQSSSPSITLSATSRPLYPASPSKSIAATNFSRLASKATAFSMPKQNRPLQSVSKSQASVSPKISTTENIVNTSTLKKDDLIEELHSTEENIRTSLCQNSNDAPDNQSILRASQNKPLLGISIDSSNLASPFSVSTKTPRASTVMSPVMSPETKEIQHVLVALKEHDRAIRALQFAVAEIDAIQSSSSLRGSIPSASGNTVSITTDAANCAISSTSSSSDTSKSAAIVKMPMTHIETSMSEAMQNAFEERMNSILSRMQSMEASLQNLQSQSNISHNEPPQSSLIPDTNQVKPSNTDAHILETFACTDHPVLENKVINLVNAVTQTQPYEPPRIESETLTSLSNDFTVNQIQTAKVETQIDNVLQPTNQDGISLPTSHQSNSILEHPLQSPIVENERITPSLSKKVQIKKDLETRVSLLETLLSKKENATSHHKHHLSTATTPHTTPIDAALTQLESLRHSIIEKVSPKRPATIYTAYHNSSSQRNSCSRNTPYECVPDTCFKNEYQGDQPIVVQIVPELRGLSNSSGADREVGKDTISVIISKIEQLEKLIVSNNVHKKNNAIYRPVHLQTYQRNSLAKGLSEHKNQHVLSNASPTVTSKTEPDSHQTPSAHQIVDQPTLVTVMNNEKEKVQYTECVEQIKKLGIDHEKLQFLVFELRDLINNSANNITTSNPVIDLAKTQTFLGSTNTELLNHPNPSPQPISIQSQQNNVKENIQSVNTLSHTVNVNRLVKVVRQLQKKLARKVDISVLEELSRHIATRDELKRVSEKRLKNSGVKRIVDGKLIAVHKELQILNQKIIAIPSCSHNQKQIGNSSYLESKHTEETIQKIVNLMLQDHKISITNSIDTKQAKIKQEIFDALSTVNSAASAAMTLEKSIVQVESKLRHDIKAWTKKQIKTFIDENRPFQTKQDTLIKEQMAELARNHVEIVWNDKLKLMEQNHDEYEEIHNISKRLTREFDEKLFLLCSDLSECKSLFSMQVSQPFYRCAQWLWNCGSLKMGSGIPWNCQTVNTEPENFKWSQDQVQLRITDAGLYEITLAIFTKSKPSIQLVVNGESVLSAINSPSYVVHHSSGFVVDGNGKLEPGTVTGISLVDFLALPAKSTLSIHYHGVRKQVSLGHGFVGLRRL
ncbi:hypothetical protein BDEG_24015 [Batrachochytrium dendrobatidis JEL423]|uniref:Uncharacterized protein n=1 Tax=Batrachochytrium dendrobatidis (strain JEL423) TaxID=403673 RepID=A0A177WKA6_BATDL|nr:hypothetical protein BDEG_24015 [Batrachochytrium dendrobatidis JEL423]